MDQCVSRQVGCWCYLCPHITQGFFFLIYLFSTSKSMYNQILHQTNPSFPNFDLLTNWPQSNMIVNQILKYMWHKTFFSHFYFWDFIFIFRILYTLWPFDLWISKHIGCLGYFSLHLKHTLFQKNYFHPQSIHNYISQKSKPFLNWTSCPIALRTLWLSTKYWNICSTRLVFTHLYLWDSCSLTFRPFDFKAYWMLAIFLPSHDTNLIFPKYSFSLSKSILNHIRAPNKLFSYLDLLTY